MIRCLRCSSAIVLTLFALLIYFNSIAYQPQIVEDDGVKKIVAYSLLKQIEIESEQIKCDSRTVEDESPAKSRWTKISHSDLYVHSAFHDGRLEPFHYLRIVGMVKGSRDDSFYCHIKTSNGDYHTKKAIKVKIWARNWNPGDASTFNPVLLSCQVSIKPVKLWLNKNPCAINGPTFKIESSRRSSTTAHITVCVKPLDFSEDISKRLVQWIEINKILGADKFEIYVKRVHEKTLAVLQWYANEFPGQLTVNFYQSVEDFAGAVPGDDLHRIWTKRRNELITYNDCLYRNLNASHFVIPVDTDEIIVSKRVYSWKQLLKQIDGEVLDGHASFSVRNAYFLEKFQSGVSKEPIFFFRDVVRTELSEKTESGKSFIATKNALTVFNHYALHVLKPGIQPIYFLNESIVQMNHYKRTCSVKLLPECIKYLTSPVRIVDTVISKYRKEFVGKYERTLQMLRLANISIV